MKNHTPTHFDIRHNQDGRLSAPRAVRTLLQRKSLRTHLLQADCTPGALSDDRRNRSLENFQGPYREYNIIYSLEQFKQKCYFPRLIHFAAQLKCG
jgi:hypothetical protein